MDKIALRVVVPIEFKRKLKALAALKEQTMGSLVREMIGDALDKAYQEASENSNN